jgi:osmotically inducible protein OsmC
MPSRNATTHWTGGISAGKGNVTLDSSNAGQYEVSFPTRSGDPDGHTSPEELIAAAHSSCLAMNLSGVLESEKLDPTSIDVSAEVTLGPAQGGGFEISWIEITLRARVDGIDAERFSELAKTAEQTCPVSKALSGTTITLDAALES